MKKKNDILKYILGTIILFAMFLAVTAKILEEDKDLNFLEETIKDTTTFIEKIFYAPIKFVKGKVFFVSNNKDIYNKYEELKKKVEKTDLYYAQIKELQKEVTELKDVLDLNSTMSEYTYVNATVVSRNIGYWYNNLTIDKGSKNGVKQGDAVITNKGLVGKVTSVSNFSSTVKLLTSDEIKNKISVKIESNNDYQYGLLIGYDSKKNAYMIEGITNSSNINKGDLVTTTGLTDYFPSGIIIGKVSKVVKDQYDLNSIVEVTPSVNFENIGIVTVLNRKAIEQ